MLFLIEETEVLKLSRNHKYENLIEIKKISQYIE